MKTPAPLAFTLAALAPLTACEFLGGGGGDGSNLPPVEALFVPKPSDPISSTEVQAACVDGNATITALEARIDELNASVADDLALLQTLYGTAPSTPAGVAVYDVDIDGRSLHVELVEAGGQIALTGKLDDEDYLSGTYNADGSTGALLLKGDDGDISSTWETADGKLAIARVEGDLHVAVAIEDNKVALAIDDGTDSEAAEWDRETRAGRYAGPASVGCWDGAEAAADMCDVTCE